MPEYYLQAYNANLCYEVDGTGPFIVIVAGGNGGAKLFKRFRDLLVKHFTVVLYDRRGFFRSKLTGPQDYSKRLDTDVDDLYKIMSNITKEKFILFGISSSGAILMDYLNKYPETLLKCFVHEPILYMEGLEGREEIRNYHLDIYNLYQNEGRNAAMRMFGSLGFNEVDSNILVERQKNDKENNWDYWFKHEWMQYPFAETDWNAAKSHQDKIVMLYGLNSVGLFTCEPGKAIAQHLGNEYVPFSGGHIGFYTNSQKFSAEFLQFCREHTLLLN
ncbi:Alpha/Beta hydrolase protein [Helicostylum pulchrum]|nr:Alpha/Beta hydrolase protein [Helicostylum pulchrum]